MELVGYLNPAFLKECLHIQVVGIRMHLRGLMWQLPQRRTNSELEMSNLYESVPLGWPRGFAVSVLVRVLG